MADGQRNNNKKALFISSYAPPAIGGPQNLYTLLRDFPQESYAILTSFYNIDNFSAKSGSWLKGGYFFYDNLSATKEERQKSGGEASQKTNILQKIKMAVKRIGWLKAVLGTPIIFSQIFMILKAGPRIAKKIGADVIIEVSDYGPAMIGGYLTHRITKKPLILFMFDLYKGNYLPFPGGLLAYIFEPKIFKSASKIIVTNGGTKDFYIKRYGEKIADKIVVIHNSVFPEGYKNNTSVITEHKPPYSLLFTGRIYWPQIGSIKNIIRAVNELDDVVFNIYCPNPKDYLKQIGIEEGLKVKISAAPPSEMPKIQGAADILLLPLSWNTKSPQIIDTATPGKLTDYLIAGKPILIHAPASTYLIKYAKENNFAAVADTEDTEKLKETIGKLAKNTDWANELVKNARETFHRNHDANKNAMIFREVINSV